MQGKVVSPAGRPRSYVVETPTGSVERNRSQLRVIPNNADAENEADSQQTETETEPEPPRRIMTRSRTGTTISEPERLTQKM